MTEYLKYIFSCILFFSMSHFLAQDIDKQNEFDQFKYRFDTLISNHFSKSYNMRSEHLHTFLKDVGALEKTKPEYYSQLIDLETHICLHLMYSVHIPRKQYDSVEYYYKRLKLDRVSIDVAARAYSIMAYYKRLDFDFAGNLSYIEKTLSLLEGSDTDLHKIRKIQITLDLLNFYLNYSSYYNVEKTLEYLEQELEKIKHLENYHGMKTHGYILKAGLYYKMNKYDEAIVILERFSADSIAKFNNYQLLIDYYRNNILVYQALNNLEKTEYFVDKFHETVLKENKTLVYDEYYNNMLILAIKQNDLDKADTYFTLINSISNKEIKNDFSIKKTIADYHEMKGNYREAFLNLKRAKHLEDSINSIKAKVQADIYSYNLSKETEITRLEEVNRNKDVLLEKNRKIYFSIFLIILLLVLILVGIIFYRRQQKSLKLNLELKTTREIAEAKQSYLENLAHEIRTPITVINGYLELIKLHTLNPKIIDKFAGMSLENSKKLLQSFDEYLVLLKDDPDISKNIFLNKEEKQIVPFFEDLIEPFLPQAHLSKITLNFKTNIDYNSKIPLPILALKCISNNLLSNALKFTPSSKSVFISLIYEESILKLTVKNEGYGISKEHREKIFERFYQTKSDDVARGFGIGLSLVKHIVDSLKGSIILESESGKGSSFRVELALENDSDIVLIPPTKVKFTTLEFYDEDNIESEKISLPNILIVDDDFEMQRYLINLFKDKYRCFTANNGSQGMEIVENNDIKLIISDLRMPKVDGYSFKEKLNTSDKYKDIPFILMSATAITGNNTKIKLGIDEYIKKPFSSQELYKRVHNILEKQIYKEKALSDEGSNIEFQGSHSRLIEKLYKHIKQNISDPDFNLNEITQNLGYSKRQVNALLKRQIGLTLTSIVLEVKLLEAYDHIVNKKYPTLNEVMYAVGINSRSYFNKIFESRFGLKPGRLMKNFE